MEDMRKSVFRYQPFDANTMMNEMCGWLLEDELGQVDFDCRVEDVVLDVLLLQLQESSSCVGCRVWELWVKDERKKKT